MTSARFVHSASGLFFCVIIVFMAGTGALSVFSTEIDWVFRPQMRIEAAADEKADLGQSLDSVLKAAPDARPLAITRFPSPRFSDRVEVALPGGEKQFVWVNPYSGQVTGATSNVSLKETLRELHRSLSTRKKLSQFAVALLSVPLFVSILSGILLYRRFWTGYFRRPRFGGSRRALLSDCHRLVAIWLLPFLLVTTVTSLIFLSELAGFGPTRPVDPKSVPERNSVVPADFHGADLDDAIDLARSSIPGLLITEVNFPRNRSGHLSIRGIDGTALVRANAATVLVDPVSVSTSAVRPSREMGVRMRVFEGVRVVHYGTLAGFPTRVLWVVFGLALVALGVLGALICVERLTKEFAIRGRPPRRGLGHFLSGPGAGNWVGLSVVLLAVALAFGDVF